MQRRVLLRMLIYQPIRGCDRLAQSFLKILFGLRAHALDQRIHSQAAGDLSGGRPAHTVADYKYTGIEADSEGVFICNPHTTRVTASSGLKLGWYLHSSKTLIDLLQDTPARGSYPANREFEPKTRQSRFRPHHRPAPFRTWCTRLLNKRRMLA